MAGTVQDQFNLGLVTQTYEYQHQQKWVPVTYQFHLLTSTTCPAARAPSGPGWPTHWEDKRLWQRWHLKTKVTHWQSSTNAVQGSHQDRGLCCSAPSLLCSLSSAGRQMQGLQVNLDAQSRLVLNDLCILGPDSCSHFRRRGYSGSTLPKKAKRSRLRQRDGHSMRVDILRNMHPMDMSRHTLLISLFSHES